MIRAKFTCQQNTLDHETQTATVVLTPANSPVDKNLTCWKATSADNITLQIHSLLALPKFRAGRDYYVDFTAV